MVGPLLFLDVCDLCYCPLCVLMSTIFIKAEKKSRSEIKYIRTQNAHQRQAPQLFAACRHLTAFRPRSEHYVAKVVLDEPSKTDEVAAPDQEPVPRFEPQVLIGEAGPLQQ